MTSKERPQSSLGRKYSAKDEEIKNKPRPKDSGEPFDGNLPQIENIEKKHLERHQIEIEERELEERKRLKSKQDIFKWLHLPLDSQENTLLKKMIRIRLLEILSDVTLLLLSKTQ